MVFSIMKLVCQLKVAICQETRVEVGIFFVNIIFSSQEFYQIFLSPRFILHPKAHNFKR